jgi:hypothetical protein
MTTEQLETWERQHYVAGGGDPMLFYVVYGEIDSSAPLSRGSYRSNGAPDGIDVMSYGPNMHPEVPGSFRDGYLWDEFAATDPELAATVGRCEHEKKTKGHAQQLGWSQRNSESNAKTIGARTASDGEFVFSTTAKASKDEASHDCRGRIRAEFERNSIDWYVPLPQSNSFVPSQRRLKAESYPVEPSADVCKMPNTQLAR